MQKDHINEVDPTLPVTEQASSWWVLLNSGDATPADHATFGDWVARSPERVEAFLQAARLVHALRSKHLMWPDATAEELIRDAKAAAGEVIDLRFAGRQREAQSESARQSIRAPRLRYSASRIAAAAVVLAVVGVAIGGYLSLKPDRYQTALGEQRSVVLTDGSVVTLNTSSSIEVTLAHDHRMVRLLGGEALFQVAHDAARPFDVSVGDTNVRAVGTKFSVDRRETGTTVTVVEGKVAVTTPESASGGAAARLALSAGEQLTVSPRSVPHPVRANVATATAWTQRKLVFEGRPLGEVAAEFNRYNRQVIEIDSAELRSQQVTGVFQADDPESFMTFLAGIPGVTIERPDGGGRWIATQAIAPDSRSIDATDNSPF